MCRRVHHSARPRGGHALRRRATAPSHEPILSQTTRRAAARQLHVFSESIFACSAVCRQELLPHVGRRASRIQLRGGQFAVDGSVCPAKPLVSGLLGLSRYGALRPPHALCAAMFPAPVANATLAAAAAIVSPSKRAAHALSVPPLVSCCVLGWHSWRWVSSRRPFRRRD